MGNKNIPVEEILLGMQKNLITLMNSVNHLLSDSLSSENEELASKKFDNLNLRSDVDTNLTQEEQQEYKQLKQIVPVRLSSLCYDNPNEQSVVYIEAESVYRLQRSILNKTTNIVLAFDLWVAYNKHDALNYLRVSDSLSRLFIQPCSCTDEAGEYVVISGFEDLMLNRDGDVIRSYGKECSPYHDELLDLMIESFNTAKLEFCLPDEVQEFIDTIRMQKTDDFDDYGRRIIKILFKPKPFIQLDENICTYLDDYMKGQFSDGWGEGFFYPVRHIMGDGTIMSIE